MRGNRAVLGRGAWLVLSILVAAALAVVLVVLFGGSAGGDLGGY